MKDFSFKSLPLQLALERPNRWHLAVFAHRVILVEEMVRVADDVTALRLRNLRLLVNQDTVRFPAAGGLKLIVLPADVKARDFDRFRGWSFASIYANGHPREAQVRTMLSPYFRP